LRVFPKGKRGNLYRTVIKNPLALSPDVSGKGLKAEFLNPLIILSPLWFDRLTTNGLFTCHAGVREERIKHLGSGVCHSERSEESKYHSICLIPMHRDSVITLPQNDSLIVKPVGTGIARPSNTET
jgi:hypothetical protein